MSVLDFGDGDLFIVRVVKFLASNPDNKWANSYEFRATAAGDATTLNSLISSLIIFEQGLHFSTVHFDHVIASTWAPDSVPYDPEAFLSVPQVATGLVGDAGAPISLDKCLSVRRVAASGRFGHLFYRGALAEGMVEAPAGKTVLTTPSALQEAVDENLDVSEFDSYIGNPAAGPMQLVMVSKTGAQVRNVASLKVAGVGTVPADHAWFNRATAGPPA